MREEGCGVMQGSGPGVSAGRSFRVYPRSHLRFLIIGPWIGIGKCTELKKHKKYEYKEKSYSAMRSPLWRERGRG